MKSIKHILLELLLIFTIAEYLLGLGKYFEGAFVTSRLALSYIIEQTGKMEPQRITRINLGDPTRTPAHDLLIYFLRVIPSMPCNFLLRVGSAVIFLSIWLIAVAYLLSLLDIDIKSAFIIAMITALDPSVRGYISISYPGIVMYPIYLAVIIKPVTGRVKNIRKLLVISTFLFTGLQYMHPVNANWGLVAPMGILLMVMFTRILKRVKSRLEYRHDYIAKTYANLTLLFFIIFLTASSLPYIAISVARARLDIVTLLSNAINKIKIGFEPEKAIGTEAVFMIEAQTWQFTVLGFLYHIINSTVIVVYLIKLVVSYIFGKGNDLDINENRFMIILLGSIIFSGISTTAMYLLIAGYPGTKYLLTMFPVASMLIFSKFLNKKNRNHLFILFLVLLMFLNIGKFYFKVGISLIKEAPPDAAIEWLYYYGIYPYNSYPKNLLVDFYTANYLALKLAEKGIDISFIHVIDDRVYFYIQGLEPPPYEYLLNRQLDYFLNTESIYKPFRTSEWKLRPGLGGALFKKPLDIVYNSIMIYFYSRH